MTDHTYYRCEICDNFYCNVCSNNEKNFPLTCKECFEKKPSELRFHFYVLINKVIETSDPFCLSHFEDFELYTSKVFLACPELLYHPVLNELYTYLRQRFEF